LIGKFVALAEKIHRNPTDMMLCGVWMRDFFADTDGNLNRITFFNLLRRIDCGDVFFCFPITALV